MILRIRDSSIRKVMPDGRTVKDVDIVPVVSGRPNLTEIDLTKIAFVSVPSKSKSDNHAILWKRLVDFMRRQLQNGFVTLGTREFIAMYCDADVDGWLRREPPTNPWKVGNGGLIGFPDGLMKMKGRPLSYDVAIWISRDEQWHVRIFDPEKGQTYPSWYSYLRLPLYPLDSR